MITDGCRAGKRVAPADKYPFLTTLGIYRCRLEMSRTHRLYNEKWGEERMITRGKRQRRRSLGEKPSPTDRKITDSHTL